jgi:hypothetical protein
MYTCEILYELHCTYQSKVMTKVKVGKESQTPRSNERSCQKEYTCGI